MNHEQQKKERKEENNNYNYSTLFMSNKLISQ